MHDLMDFIISNEAMKYNEEKTDKYIKYLESIQDLDEIIIYATCKELKRINDLLDEKIKRKIKVKLYLKKPAEIGLNKFNQFTNNFNIDSIFIKGFSIERIDGRSSIAIIKPHIMYYYLLELKSLTRGLKKYIGTENEIKACGTLIYRLANRLNYNDSEEEFNSLGKKYGNIDVPNEIKGLLENKAVCTGFSGIFRDAWNMIGGRSKEIYGFSDNFGHMWNQVNINGKWYNLDLTLSYMEIRKGNFPLWILQSDEEFSNSDVTSSLKFKHKNLRRFKNNEEICNEDIDKMEILNSLKDDEEKKEFIKKYVI